MAFGPMPPEAQRLRDGAMPLTRRFKETFRERVYGDPAFRDALLREGVQCLLVGDIDTGRLILRNYVNATIGFESLGRAVDTPPESLMPMFGPRGNPNARNLLAAIDHLQRAEFELSVQKLSNLAFQTEL
jgi:hypothetical protein